MNILRIKLVGAILLFSSATAFAEPTYLSVTGLSTASSLTQRAWPSSSSRPINNIPYNATNIEATGRHIFKEDKKWLQITYQNNTGWVEASYLTEMQAASAQQLIEATAVTAPTLDANSANEFNYSQQFTASQQAAVPKNIPWTAQEDTIYHDPTPQQLAGPGANIIERVEATHTLVVINKKQDEGDFRGENVAGNRYESIQASMSVQYQP